MRTVDELLEKARKLPLKAQRELRDRLIKSLEQRDSGWRSADAGPYGSLLGSAGSTHSRAPDVSRNNRTHLAESYAPKRSRR